MDTITIYLHPERGTFNVTVGDRIADQLTFDEMLGLVAAVAMPQERRGLQWLKTVDEWRERTKDMTLRAIQRDEALEQAVGHVED